MIGSPYAPDQISHGLELIRPRELELVEVYRGREEIPGMFRSLDAGAAIVMWTRAPTERSGR